MLYQRYSKTQNLTRRRSAILRFLPKPLSRQLVGYLSLVKPLESIFVAQIFGTQAGIDCRHYLFWKKGKRLSQDQLYNLFPRVLASLKVNINLSSYRHVAIAFMRVMKLDPKATGLLPIDEQAGHSEETGTTHYARNNSELLETTAEREHGFFLVSQAWHHCLNIR